MTDYTVKYVDKVGDYQEFKTIAKDVRQAISTVTELCPDCRRVIQVMPTEMFED